jgi:quercetin dioxygenase-like cupin family protein
MANDAVSGQALFEEPEGELEMAGDKVIIAKPMPYDLYMEREGLPVYRAIGYPDVRELPLAPWRRLGGNGAFLQPKGTEGKGGMYLLEIPPRAALNVERHLFEEILYVMEGRGTTELGEGPKGPAQLFEWSAGSLFAIPMNVDHRLINATDQRALILAGTSAPPIINHYDNDEFVFSNPFAFTDRYSGESDYFEYKTTYYADPKRGRAMQLTSFLPDIVHAEMPLDNQRSPGFRRTEPHMAGGNFYLKIMQHEVGRYSKAHFHHASAVLICLTGKGYTYTWPHDLGPHPFESGHGDKVQRVDYGPGGIVAAAPGGGDWYHQHFAVGAEPLRLLVYDGPITIFGENHAPGERVIGAQVNRDEGGRSVEYFDEDPHFKAEFERMLARDGLRSTMPEAVYDKNSAASVSIGRLAF